MGHGMGETILGEKKIIIIGNNNWNPKNKGDDLDKMLNQFKEKVENFFSKGPKSFIMGFLVLGFFMAYEWILYYKS